MKTKKEKTPPPTREDNLAFWVKDLEEKIDQGKIPANPTRLFNVGDPVSVGNLKNCEVTRVIREGLGYVVHYDYMGESYGLPSRKVGDNVCEWMAVLPFGSGSGSPRLAVEDDIRIRLSNSSVSGILHHVYSFGVDFNPEYQRGIAWSHDQKVALIDSIFNRVDIGKFTFNDRDYRAGMPMYEVIDGKQRLMALCEFYEDRFEYRGLRFSQLHWHDKHHFTDYGVALGIVQNASLEQVLRLFVKLNTCGTPMDPSHIEKVRKMIPE